MRNDHALYVLSLKVEEKAPNPSMIKLSKKRTRKYQLWRINRGYRGGTDIGEKGGGEIEIKNLKIEKKLE